MSKCHPDEWWVRQRVLSSIMIFAMQVAVTICCTGMMSRTYLCQGLSADYWSCCVSRCESQQLLAIVLYTLC